MIINLQQKRSTFIYRAFSAFIAVTFVMSSIVPPQRAYAQTPIVNLPVPGTMVPLSPAYAPTMIKGIMIEPENPLQFDFIIDTGNADLEGEAFNNEATKLIKYFLASLTVPEEEMWVNLSPYEQDRMIPDSFGKTEMGRDLLAQDYLLKQLTASLMYPEDDLGKEFWERIYAKVQQEYGTSEIPVDTFNKVWIVPESANVFEHAKGAYVVNSHLKVMLESDYLALAKGGSSLVTRGPIDNKTRDTRHESQATDLIREIIIPEIEHEVNNGETFANLRQIFNSMILATWYKQNLKESLLSQVYVNQNRIKGVDQADPFTNNQIYDQYIEAFKKGVYNYIKEDFDPATQETIPRKYFSGGFANNLNKDIVHIETGSSPAAINGTIQGEAIHLTARIKPEGERVEVAKLEQHLALSSSPANQTPSDGSSKLTGKDIDYKFINSNKPPIVRVNGQELNFVDQGNINFLYQYKDTTIRVNRNVGNQFIQESLDLFIELGNIGLSPKVIASGFTGDDRRNGHHFVQVDTIVGRNIKRIGRLNQIDAQHIIDLLKGLLERNIDIYDFKPQNVMIGYPKQEGETTLGAYMVDPDIIERDESDRSLLAQKYLQNYYDYHWDEFDTDRLIKNYLENEARGLSGSIQSDNTDSPSSPVELRTIDGLPDTVNGIFIIGNWDLPYPALKPVKIIESLDTIRTAFGKTDEIFFTSHFRRPKRAEWENGATRDEFSLHKQVIPVARRVFEREGIDAVIIELPHDFSKIQKIMDRARTDYPNNKRFFVFENNRSYPHQSRYYLERKPDQQDQTQFIKEIFDVLPSGTAIIDEAPSSHDTDATKQMTALFPNDMRAAGVAYQESIGKALSYESRSARGPRLTIVGGAKYDKISKHLVQFLSDLGTARESDTFYIVGALAYAALRAEGKIELGGSYKHGEKEQHAINEAWSVIKEAATRKNVNVLVSKDHRIRGVQGSFKNIKTDQAAVGPGDATINDILRIIQEIKDSGQGGIFFNGGGTDIKELAAVLETDGRIIEVIGRAADDGIAVLASGGDTADLFNLLKENGIYVSDNIDVTSAGGTIQAGLAIGVTNTKSVQALLNASSPVETKSINLAQYALLLTVLCGGACKGSGGSAAAVTDQDPPKFEPPVDADQIIPGINLWLAVQTDPFTGLVESYHNTADPFLQDKSSTYDQALAVMGHIQFRDMEAARAIMDFFVRQWDWRGFVNFYITSTGAEDIGGSDIRTGPNVWLALAALQLYHATGERSYFDLARNVAIWVRAGVPHDIEGGIAAGPVDQSAPWTRIFSTEENIDYAALLMQLLSAREQLSANEIQSFERELGGAKNWIRNRFNETAGIFDRGRDDAIKALDTTTFALLTFGPQVLRDEFGIDPDQLIKNSERYFGVTAAVAGTGEVISGFDFTDAAFRSPVVWIEGTRQMINVYDVMEKWHRSKGNTETADHYRTQRDFYQVEVDKVKRLETDGRISYPYASQGLIPVFLDSFSTPANGPDGQPATSTASTVWTMFGLEKFYNPMSSSPVDSSENDSAGRMIRPMHYQRRMTGIELANLHYLLSVQLPEDVYLSYQPVGTALVVDFDEPVEYEIEIRPGDDLPERNEVNVPYLTAATLHGEDMYFAHLKSGETGSPTEEIEFLKLELRLRNLGLSVITKDDLPQAVAEEFKVDKPELDDRHPISSPVTISKEEKKAFRAKALKRPINVLNGIPQRTQNALINMGIETLGQLSVHAESELMSISRSSQQYINVLKEELRRFGLLLGLEETGVRPFGEVLPYLDDLFNQSIDILNLDPRYRNALLRSRKEFYDPMTGSSINTIGELIARSKEELLLRNALGPVAVSRIEKSLALHGVSLYGEPEVLPGGVLLAVEARKRVLIRQSKKYENKRGKKIILRSISINQRELDVFEQNYFDEASSPAGSDSDQEQLTEQDRVGELELNQSTIAKLIRTYGIHSRSQISRILDEVILEVFLKREGVGPVTANDLTQKLERHGFRLFTLDEKFEGKMVTLRLPFELTDKLDNDTYNIGIGPQDSIDDLFKHWSEQELMEEGLVQKEVQIINEALKTKGIRKLFKNAKERAASSPAPVGDEALSVSPIKDGRVLRQAQDGSPRSRDGEPFGFAQDSSRPKGVPSRVEGQGERSEPRRTTSSPVAGMEEDDARNLILKDEKYMDLVLSLAERKLKEGELPIVAIAVNNLTDEILIGDRPLWEDEEAGVSLYEHTEMDALKKAVEQGWRMENVDIYISVESCLNCAMGIANNFRPNRVIVGTIDALPRIRGRGMEIIKNAKIPVTVVPSEAQQTKAQSLMQKVYEMTGLINDDNRNAYSFIPMDWNIDELSQDSEELKRRIEEIISGDEFSADTVKELSILVYYFIQTNKLLPDEEFPQIIAVDANHQSMNDFQISYKNSLREVLGMLRRLNVRDDRFKVILLGNDENIKSRYHEIIESQSIQPERIYVLRVDRLLTYKEFDSPVSEGASSLVAVSDYERETQEEVYQELSNYFKNELKIRFESGRPISSHMSVDKEGNLAIHFHFHDPTSYNSERNGGWIVLSNLPKRSETRWRSAKKIASKIQFDPDSLFVQMHRTSKHRPVRIKNVHLQDHIWQDNLKNVESQLKLLIAKNIRRIYRALREAPEGIFLESTTHPGLFRQVYTDSWRLARSNGDKAIDHGFPQEGFLLPVWDEIPDWNPSLKEAAASPVPAGDEASESQAPLDGDDFGSWSPELLRMMMPRTPSLRGHAEIRDYLNKLQERGGEAFIIQSENIHRLSLIGSEDQPSEAVVALSQMIVPHLFIMNEDEGTVILKDAAKLRSVRELEDKIVSEIGQYWPDDENVGAMIEVRNFILAENHLLHGPGGFWIHFHLHNDEGDGISPFYKNAIKAFVQQDGDTIQLTDIWIEEDDRTQNSIGFISLSKLVAEGRVTRKFYENVQKAAKAEFIERLSEDLANIDTTITFNGITEIQEPQAVAGVRQINLLGKVPWGHRALYEKGTTWAKAESEGPISSPLVDDVRTLDLYFGEDLGAKLKYTTVMAAIAKSVDIEQVIDDYAQKFGLSEEEAQTRLETSGIIDVDKKKQITFNAEDVRRLAVNPMLEKIIFRHIDVEKFFRSYTGADDIFVNYQVYEWIKELVEPEELMDELMDRWVRKVPISLINNAFYKSGQLTDQHTDILFTDGFRVVVDSDVVKPNAKFFLYVIKKSLIKQLRGKLSPRDFRIDKTSHLKSGDEYKFWNIALAHALDLLDVDEYEFIPGDQQSYLQEYPNILTNVLKPATKSLNDELLRPLASSPVGFRYDVYEESHGYRYGNIFADEKTREEQLAKLRSDYEADPELVLDWHIYQEFRSAFVESHEGDAYYGKLLDRAVVIASQYHAQGANAIHVDLRPYIVHPLETAYHILRLGITDERAILAALFHDVLEYAVQEGDEEEAFKDIFKKLNADRNTSAYSMMGELDFDIVSTIVFDRLTPDVEFDNDIGHLDYLSEGLDHFDTMNAEERFIFETAAVIKSAGFLQALMTNESPHNKKPFQMAKETINRWREFVNMPVIPEALKRDVNAMLYVATFDINDYDHLGMLTKAYTRLEHIPNKPFKVKMQKAISLANDQLSERPLLGRLVEDGANGFHIEIDAESIRALALLHFMSTYKFNDLFANRSTNKQKIIMDTFMAHYQILLETVLVKLRQYIYLIPINGGREDWYYSFNHDQVEILAKNMASRYSHRMSTDRDIPDFVVSSMQLSQTEKDILRKMKGHPYKDQYNEQYVAISLRDEYGQRIEQYRVQLFLTVEQFGLGRPLMIEHLNQGWTWIETQTSDLGRASSPSGPGRGIRRVEKVPVDEDKRKEIADMIHDEPEKFTGLVAQALGQKPQEVRVYSVHRTYSLPVRWLRPGERVRIYKDIHFDFDGLDDFTIKFNRLNPPQLVLSANFYYEDNAQMIRKVLGALDIDHEVDDDPGLISSPVGTDQPGGIDMNPKNLDLQTQGGRFEFDLPAHSIDLQNIRIDGFTPVIINVTPLINLPLLLGLVDDEGNNTQKAERNPEPSPADHRYEDYLEVSRLD